MQGKGPSALCMCASMPVHASRTSEEEFEMLSLPTSFAKAIELSRQFSLILSLCKFTKHMV